MKERPDMETLHNKVVYAMCKQIAEASHHSKTEFEVAREVAHTLDMDPRDVRLIWDRIRTRKSAN